MRNINNVKKIKEDVQWPSKYTKQKNRFLIRGILHDIDLMIVLLNISRDEDDKNERIRKT